MKVVIMAGGMGTRISSLAKDVPKPMIKIGEKPILEHQIECLKEQGFTDIILTVGHLGNHIINYFGDGSVISPVTGKSFGVNISYYFENKPLGNAGALFKIKDKLEDDFLLINGDLMFNVDFNRFVKFHKSHNGLVTLFTHPNSHPYDSGLIFADENGLVYNWLSKEDIRPKYYKNRTNAGIHIISPKVLDKEIELEKIDLDRQILKPIIKSKKVYCYDSSEYVKDMGTIERYNRVSIDYKSGLINEKNLREKQKAIFLDRDGTINEYVGFLKNIEDFKLIDGVAESIKKINEAGYLAIVITNQPVIARGDVKVKELEEIHNKMETLLGEKGAYLDAIYYCPHHPDKGYKGEVTELKIDCNCRKPKIGMILQAAEDLNIDIKKSWIIGDSKNDILAGINAGCKTALIGEDNFGQLKTVNSLREFVDDIFK